MAASLDSVLSLDATPLDEVVGGIKDSLNDNAPVDVLTFITPGGRYTLPREAVAFSPVLDQLLSVYPDLVEFDLVKLLRISPASEAVDADGDLVKTPAHSLYNIPERYYALVFKFFNQLHLDNGLIPGMPGLEKLKDLSEDGRKLVESEMRADLQAGKINPFPPHCTIFDPTSSNVLPQAYWSMVKDWAAAPSLNDIGAFDYVALNFGNYALSKLNELAGAFWMSKNEAKLAEERHHVEHIIQRDVSIKVKEREREAAKKKAADEAKASSSASAAQ